MSLLRILGVLPFPWTTVLIWAFVGLLAAMVLAAALWGTTPGGQTVYIRFAIFGALTGAFLGLCYHVLVCVCRLQLQ
jgi:hypothetical protein